MYTHRPSAKDKLTMNKKKGPYWKFPTLEENEK